MKKVIFLQIIVLISITLHAENEIIPLEEMINLSLMNSPEINSLRYETEKADAQLNAAKAEQYPLLSGNISYSFLGNPNDGIVLEAGSLGVLPGPTPLPSEQVTMMDPMGYNYYNLSLKLSQPIFTWGKLHNSVLISQNYQELVNQKLRSGEIKLETEVEMLYTTLSILSEIQNLLIIQKEKAERSVFIVQESYLNGFLLKSDLLEAQISEQQINIAELEIMNQISDILSRLEHLSGIEEIRIENLELTAPQEIWMLYNIPDSDYLMQQALILNPDLQQLLRLININESIFKISTQNARHLPDIGLQLEAAYSSDVFPFTENEWFDNGFSFTATIAVTGTILDFGRERAAKDEAEADLNIAQENYSDTISLILNTIEETVMNMELAKANILYAQLKEEKSLEDINTNRNLWLSGAGGEELLLQEEIIFYTTEIEKLEAILDYYGNYFQLVYLTGERYNSGN